MRQRTTRSGNRISMHWMRVQWREFWSAPDPLLQHQGGSGELTVASIRILVIGALLVLALLDVVQTSTERARIAATVAAAALVIAFGVYLFTRRSFYRPWLGFATSLLDVTLVSGALTVFVLVGRPDIAANSRVLYATYFVAIGAMALRNDPRVCALGGLIGVLQYGALIAYADVQWNLAEYASDMGTFELNTHYGRLLLLTFAAFLSTQAVLRTQRLRWMAAKDPLTQLMNRGTFDERAQAEVSRAVRYNHTLSIAMMDIDHFKKFNDTYGHLVGDEVLRFLGEILPKSLRDSDLVARYGGEEFIILFPETPATGAVKKAEYLRESIAHSSVTVSIGVAELPVDSSDLRIVIDVADQRLYQAKRAGRNRVFGPEGEVPRSDAEEMDEGEEGTGKGELEAGISEQGAESN